MKKSHSKRSSKAVQPKRHNKSSKPVRRRHSKAESSAAVQSAPLASAPSSLNPRLRVRVLEEQGEPKLTRGTQAGDFQGISDREISDSESVEELLDEGQDLEGEEIEGIEAVQNADQGEIKAPEPPTRRRSYIGSATGCSSGSGVFGCHGPLSLRLEDVLDQLACRGVASAVRAVTKCAAWRTSATALRTATARPTRAITGRSGRSSPR